MRTLTEPTLSAWMRLAQQQLQAIYPAPEAEAIVRRWVQAALDLDGGNWVLRKSDLLTVAEIQQLDAGLARLMQAEPVQYLIGYEDFWGLRLRVSPAVLIPRPETEELCRHIVKHCSQFKPGAQTIRGLDIGTGSGCIPIALTHHLPKLQMCAVDVSPEAVALAGQNALMCNLQTRIDWDIRDVLSKDFWSYLQSKPPFDFLVSNPPYVLPEEALTLRPNVREYEPHLALFSPLGESGTVFYEVILSQASRVLKAEGQVFLELHTETAQKVLQMARKMGFEAHIIPDFWDRPRFLFASLNSSNLS